MACGGHSELGELLKKHHSSTGTAGTDGRTDSKQIREDATGQSACVGARMSAEAARRDCSVSGADRSGLESGQYPKIVRWEETATS